VSNSEGGLFLSTQRPQSETVAVKDFLVGGDIGAKETFHHFLTKNGQPISG